eukprot:SAG22_NODE_5021_length_1105_cov_1.358847_1_plen_223_part_10
MASWMASSSAAGRLGSIAAGVGCGGGAPVTLPPVSPMAPPQPAAAGQFALLECTIAGVHEALLRGGLTCVQLVEAYLERVRRYNGQSVRYPTAAGLLGPVELVPDSGQLNAFATVNLRPARRAALGFAPSKARSLTDAADADPTMPDALEVAAALDRQLAETGSLAGPLHGVVFAIKDQYDTRDMRTTSGAAADYADDRPLRDATFITRLRQAGAILLGKSNL